jgi:hypothetical protein
MATLAEGAQAPTFTLPDQDGDPVSLDDFKGPGCSSTSTRPTTPPAERTLSYVPIHGL